MTTFTQTAVSNSASLFNSQIGINTHLGSWEPLYENPTTVLNALSYLGISQVRDNFSTASDATGEYNTLANAGIKFDFIVRSPMDATTFANGVASFLKGHPGALQYVEGPNEIDIQPFTYNGSTSMASVAAFQKAFYNTINGTAGLADIPVLNLTLSQWNSSDVSQLGNLTASSDYGNVHAYAWSQASPWSVVATDIQHALSVSSNHPVVITELGYTNTLSNTFDGVSEAVQAKSTLNELFDAYAQGAVKSYLYELFDESADKTYSEGNFGLFRYDGSAKPAAVALHNLTTILADPHTGSAAPATSLTYNLTNLPSSGHSMLLEKSDGRIDLVVWAEPTIWNASTQSATTAATSTVGVSLPSTFSSLKVYDPLSGTSPIASYSNASSLSVAVSDHPIIIELTPSGTTGGSTPPPTTPTSPTPPAAPTDSIVPTLWAQESVSGATNKTVDVISGVAHDDASGISAVKVYDNGKLLGAATVASDGSFSYTAQNLASGSHAFTAVAVDGSGNTSAAASAGASVLVDTTAPTLTATESVSGWTANTSDVISGSVKDAGAGVAAVKVYDYGTLLGSATVASDGSWSYTAQNLASGSHAFNAIAVDNAGNNSAAVSAGPSDLVDANSPTMSILSEKHTGSHYAVFNFGSSDGSVGSGVHHYLWWTDTNAKDAAAPSWAGVLSSTTTSVQADLSQATPNHYYLHMAAVDNVGHTSAFSDWLIT